MKKFLLAALAVCTLSLTTGCQDEKKDAVPGNEPPIELSVPAGARLLNIECGQPCVLYLDAETMTFYAKMADGRILQVTQDE